MSWKHVKALTWNLIMETIFLRHNIREERGMIKRLIMVDIRGWGRRLDRRDSWGRKNEAKEGLKECFSNRDLASWLSREDLGAYEAPDSLCAGDKHYFLVPSLYLWPSWGSCSTMFHAVVPSLSGEIMVNMTENGSLLAFTFWEIKREGVKEGWVSDLFKRRQVGRDF